MCFDICTINIRVSIRVRGLHLFFIFGKHQLTRNQATFSSPERCPEVHLEERARRASRNSLPIFLQVFSPFCSGCFTHFFPWCHLFLPPWDDQFLLGCHRCRCQRSMLQRLFRRIRPETWLDVEKGAEALRNRDAGMVIMVTREIDQ